MLTAISMATGQTSIDTSFSHTRDKALNNQLPQEDAAQKDKLTVRLKIELHFDDHLFADRGEVSFP